MVYSHVNHCWNVFVMAMILYRRLNANRYFITDETIEGIVSFAGGMGLCWGVVHKPRAQVR